MSDTTPPPGLRERKRAATRRSIQMAVLELVREEGVEPVTVDMVSRRADVSPRTFFNYFASKEDALVGEVPSFVEGAPVDRFVADRDRPVLEGLVDLIDLSLRGSTDDHDLVQTRRRVLRAHPDLFARRVAGMREFEEGLGVAVARRLEADQDADGGPESRASRAHLVTLVVMAALRHAWVEWADDDDDEHLSDADRYGVRARLETSFAQLAELVSREG